MKPFEPQSQMPKHEKIADSANRRKETNLKYAAKSLWIIGQPAKQKRWMWMVYVLFAACVEIRPITTHLVSGALTTITGHTDLTHFISQLPFWYSWYSIAFISIWSIHPTRWHIFVRFSRTCNYHTIRLHAQIKSANRANKTYEKTDVKKKGERERGGGTSDKDKATETLQ